MNKNIDLFNNENTKNIKVDVIRSTGKITIKEAKRDSSYSKHYKLKKAIRISPYIIKLYFVKRK